MCEASRHASDQAFVCSSQQLMVCILACAPAFLILPERQVDRVTDKPPALQMMSVSFIASALLTEAGIILKKYIQINGETFVLKCATIPSKSPTRKKFHGMIDDLHNVEFISSNVHSSRKEALMYIFEDNEALIKMIIKGRSPTMRHVSRTHRVALDWLFDRINLDPNIQIEYIDTKIQLADMLTKGKFTRDEWNHLLCLFNIGDFGSIGSFKAMSKRTQEDAGEERVRAKSKPMMNLVSRCHVRDPNVLASTASESPVKTKSESQNVPLSSLNVQQTSTERPVLGASSSNYSEWNIDDKWSSQVWKSGEMSNTSTRRPVYDKFVIDDDMDSDTAAESNLSLKSRSFLNRVDDRLRKMLNRSPKDPMQDIDKRFIIW